MTMLGAIEAGGTKFLCGLGDADGHLLVQRAIPTTSPRATFAAAAGFLAEAARGRPLAAIGIASFGPLDLVPGSPGYGRMLSTPKPGWSGADLPACVRQFHSGPLAIETDVNAAALAEAALADAGVTTLAYITVGTGIGAGLIHHGRAHQGAAHPELGHVPVRRHPLHGDFSGICPFHGDCLEGLASGPAIAAAFGQPAETLPADHPAFIVVADYLGQCAAMLLLGYAPQRIVLGGGVMQQPHLLPMVRARTARWLGGYYHPARSAADLDAIIARPRCRHAPGLEGALRLAIRASQG